jgi:hypothetical protein
MENELIPLGSERAWISDPIGYCNRDKSGYNHQSDFQGLGCMFYVLNGIDY